MSTLGGFSSGIATGKQLLVLWFHFVGCPQRCFCQHSTSISQQESAVTKDVLHCLHELYGLLHHHSWCCFWGLHYKAPWESTYILLSCCDNFNICCVQGYIFAANMHGFSSLNILSARVNSYFKLCTVFYQKKKKSTEKLLGNLAERYCSSR